MATSANPVRDPLGDEYWKVRALTLALAAPLSDADATLQAHPDASPAKWHLAHTAWFFETFVLRDRVPGYRRFDARWPFLFNSYYDGEGARIARAARGLISRPTLDEVRAYRAHVDEAMAAAIPGLPEQGRALVELGLQHEMQHQELLLTDILVAFAGNPLGPAYVEILPGTGRGATGRSPLVGGAQDDARDDDRSESGEVGPLHHASHGRPPRSGEDWVDLPGGLHLIGADGPTFAFDAERPRHRVFLEPYRLAARTVTNADWDAFVADGGYETPTLWLADGWAWVEREGIAAPLHWREDGQAFTLAGLQPRDPDAPVTHVSHYEADAFARWAGARLPTEAEWEAAASRADPSDANLLDEAGPVAPRQASAGPGVRALFGDVWEWTASAFLPYPGFRPAPGTVGEYNGKFMSGQAVLRGGSCATPRAGVTATTRNFFPPHARWQFSGVRLAKDI